MFRVRHHCDPPQTLSIVASDISGAWTLLALRLDPSRSAYTSALSTCEQSSRKSISESSGVCLVCSSDHLRYSSSGIIAMCNLVVPIRTCSKCRQREPLFHDTSLRDNNEKVGSDEVGDMFPIPAPKRGMTTRYGSPRSTWTRHKTAIRAGASSAANTRKRAVIVG
jgi:hypothetical protein